MGEKRKLLMLVMPFDGLLKGFAFEVDVRFVFRMKIQIFGVFVNLTLLIVVLVNSHT